MFDQRRVWCVAAVWTMASLAGARAPTPVVQLRGAAQHLCCRDSALRIFEDGALEWDDGIGPVKMATLTTRERQQLRAAIDATDFDRLEFDPIAEMPADAVLGSFLTRAGVHTVPLWQLRSRLDLWSLVEVLRKAHPLRVREQQPGLKLTVDKVTSQLPRAANASLRDEVRTRVKGLRQCVDRTVTSRWAKGSINLCFNTGARGVVSVSSSVDSEYLRACVRTVARTWVLRAKPTPVRVALSFAFAHSSPQEVSAAIGALRREARRCADTRGFRFTLLPDGRATEVTVPDATPEAVDCVERVVLDWDSQLAIEVPSRLTVPPAPASDPR